MSKKEKTYDFTNAKSGAVTRTARNKMRITIRVDADILNWFRAQVHQAGGNYQTMINEALREHIRQQDFTLE